MSHRAVQMVSAAPHGLGRNWLAYSNVLKDIKVGDHVVIHATKKDNKLVAATVQVGMGKMAGMRMGANSSSAATQPQ